MGTIKLNNMKNILLILLLTSAFSTAQQPAFPTAYGAGANITGGRGGVVIHVTSLNDIGAGSLRWALTDDSHKGVTRYIIFDVSGVIQLQSKIVMHSDDGYVGNYTVNGFSAPRGGITILDYPIYNKNMSNYIWRGVRFRNGYKDNVVGEWYNQSTLNHGESWNFIIDGCSFAYCKETATGGGSVKRATDIGGITFQNNLFTDSARGIAVGDSNGSLASDVSMHRNVFCNIGWRFPKGGAEIKLDNINNIVHNWQGRTIRMDAWDYELNMIGNYYQGNLITNVAQRNDKAHFTTWTNITMSPKIWDEDNFITEAHRSTGYPENPENAWYPFHTSTEPINADWFVDGRLALLGRNVPLLPSSSLKEKILPTVGASQYIDNNGDVQFYRDTADENAVSIVQNNTDTTYTSESNYEGLAHALIGTTPSDIRPANFYINNPHIPEVWFADNVPAGQDHNDISPNGYTWLEEYLNQIDGDFVSEVVTPNARTDKTKILMITNYP
jgi:hypothetical protein